MYNSNMSNPYGGGGGRSLDARGQKNRQNDQSVKDHQELLWGLKFTVEGLLAVQTTNVWSTYGGLARLCGQLDKIFRHRLRERQALFAVDNDYWLFIQGLRRIHPVLAPSLDRLNRDAGQRGVGRGHLWLKTSLEEHTLSNHLKMLVDERDHLRKCYYSDAFLCSVSHFSALYMCLQAVEQNNASLLADIDPMLLQKPKGFSTVNLNNDLDDLLLQQDPIPTRTSYPEDIPFHQPPPFASPQSDSILETSGEHAVPHTPPSTGGESQRFIARNILQCVLDTADGKPANTSLLSENKPAVVGNDPLLNTEFLRGGNFIAPVGTILGHKPAKAPSTNVGSSSSVDKSDRIVTKGVCNCSRSALFYLDDDEEEEDVIRDGQQNYSKDVNQNLCRTCGKLKSVKMALSSSSSEALSSPSAPLNHVTTEGTTISTLTKPKTLQVQYASHSTTDLAGSDSVTVPAAVKRKILHKRSQSDVQLSRRDGAGYQDAMNGSSFDLSSSLPEDGRKGSRRGSFLENGAVSPATECYFPQPALGQSLMSFLSSQDFKNCPELDKENAHFCISEAIIAAVEQIKVKQVCKSPSDHESDDDEIQELKQRIRLRRSEKKRAKIFSRFNENSRTDLTTTTSSSAYSSSLSGTEESDSSEDVDDFDLSDPGDSNLLAQQSKGLTTSMASLYSDADLKKSNSSNTSLEYNITPPTIKPMSTAETVALSLLKKYSVKQLPAASDLEWMVSEQDAPQALLPLPKSLPISPDDGENADLYTLPNNNTRLRGNMEWAPPRAQIIFNIHPPPKRKVLIAKQNYRCAGCGMRVEQGFMKRLRYCEYLGKYFCHCCHNNATAYIPGRMLRKWDFHKYPVSNFALELLNKMHEDPLFNVTDINPSLYRRVKQLNICKQYRLQLFYLKDFLKTCRLSQSLLMTFQSHAEHLVTDPHVYSMADMIRVKNADLEMELSLLVEDAVAHITQCQLCQAKGFICELCSDEQDIIFPFQLLKTYQCPACWSCYHKMCWQTSNRICPKCERIKARKHFRENAASPKVERTTPVDEISPLLR